MDPGRVGVMGFSAGGHLASMAATLFAEKLAAETEDAIDQLACRPDFAILCYPVIAMGEPYCHGGSVRNLLGANPSQELLDRCNTAKRVSKETPPVFLVHSADDRGVPLRNSMEFMARCAENKVPVSAAIFSEGGHGYGLNGRGDSAGWPERLEEWMAGRKLIAEPRAVPDAPEVSPSTVLLITSPGLAEAWMPFAEWKKSKGKPTTIVTTTQIAASFDGPDLQEKIRRCVRRHIDGNGTRWVILGGDSQPGGKGVVPDRDTVHQTMWGRNDKIPTDIYYLSRSDWDADEDGIYGEFKDDRDAISYPDGTIGLGRIPVRSAADVKAYTKKVIAYESRYPAGKFGTTMVYTCTVAGAYPKVRRSWDDHVAKPCPAERWNATSPTRPPGTRTQRSPPSSTSVLPNCISSATRLFPSTLPRRPCLRTISPGLGAIDAGRFRSHARGLKCFSGIPPQLPI